MPTVGTPKHVGQALRGFSLALALTVASVTGRAAEPSPPTSFVIENSVFDEDDKKIGGSTTIFHEGKVYDSLSEHDAVCVFDATPGRFLLLDGERKLRTEITTQQLTEFCDQLRERALAAGSGYVKFAATPTFAERLDPETNELVLASDFVDYRVRMCAPKNDAFLKRYQEFSFWQTKLNAMVNPGAPPPGARLKLNDALASRQQLPENLTMRRHGLLPGMSKTLRAEHRYRWHVGEPERRRIAEIESQLGTYQVVAFGEYLRPVIESARK